MSKDKVFSMRDVFKVYKPLNKVKSVSSPSAQSATLCDEVCPAVAPSFDVVCFLGKHPELVVAEKAVIELMALYGLRISEVLSINRSDISQGGSIRVRALKGSSIRVIQSFMFREFWISQGSSLLPLSSVYSRFYFYRLFRKYGLYSTFGVNEKASVTHYFRHLKGLEVQTAFNDWELTASSLGHKSQKSTVFYGQKIRK